MHKLVKDLFELDQNEQIFYEFSCTLSRTPSLPGRLYVTEHFLCFNAQLLGFEKKVSDLEISDLVLFLLTPLKMI